MIELDTCCTWTSFPQGSPEWLQARCGLLTASRMIDAMSYNRSGKESSARAGYRKDLVAERFTGIPTPCFISYAMRWGTEQEDNARRAYTEFTGNQVEQRGLAISTEIEFFGASVDGLIGYDGTAEIKCPESSTYLEWVVAGEVPEQHIPQMLAGLAVTGRKWCDFIAYDPRFPVEQDLFVRRFTPSTREIAAVKAAAKQFLNEVAEMERRFLKAKMY